MKLRFIMLKKGADAHALRHRRTRLLDRPVQGTVACGLASGRTHDRCYKLDSSPMASSAALGEPRLKEW